MKTEGKIKLKVEERFQVLDWFAEGKTMDQVVAILAEKHPGASMEKIKLSYFPNTNNP